MFVMSKLGVGEDGMEKLPCQKEYPIHIGRVMCLIYSEIYNAYSVVKLHPKLYIHSKILKIRECV